MLGYQVSWPLEPAVYDVVVGAGGKLHRVQVKTTTWQLDGQWACKITRSESGQKAWYTSEEIDYFGIVDGDLHVHMIPVGVLDGLGTVVVPALRRVPRADERPLGWTALHGLWRSLVARPAGGRKAAGSNPVSPTRTEQVATAREAQSPVPSGSHVRGPAAAGSPCRTTAVLASWETVAVTVREAGPAVGQRRLARSGPRMGFGARPGEVVLLEDAATEHWIVHRWTGRAWVGLGPSHPDELSARTSREFVDGTTARVAVRWRRGIHVRLRSGLSVQFGPGASLVLFTVIVAPAVWAADRWGHVATR